MIPVDEKYLHRFMGALTSQASRKKDKAEGDEFDDAQSVASDEFDMLLGWVFFLLNCLKARFFILEKNFCQIFANFFCEINFS